MRIELVPSSLPFSELQFLVSFIVNDVIAIDGGSIGFLSDLRRQQKLKHVFITHEHLDHIASLPIFLENVYEPGMDCVEVLAAASILDFLHTDIFNGRVWPDFFKLSQPNNPFMKACILEPLRPVQLAGLTITPVPVSHGTETLGLIVDDGAAVVGFPSDTGPTELFWRHLATFDNLKAVFLEVSFPATCADLAAATGHLCTTTFASEIKKLTTEVRWIVVHRKARYADQIASELRALSHPGVEFVCPGMVYDF